MTAEREFNSASFYQFLSEKKLMAARCKKCHSLYLPPHPLCIQCHGTDMEWVEMKGNGKLAAFTAISVGPSFTLDEGYDRDNPYLVGIVELDEGPKVSGRIQGLDPKKPEDIKVGTPVTVEFLEPEEGKRCYIAFKAI
ncbi:MAG TPA: Zn-ribbon domain-containing OB-fold protein [Dehalococcoidia bacterium]|nr:Zn-ribbon domain-containing OB-fold protein [Dehalococcoidia bacterium]